MKKATHKVVSFHWCLFKFKMKRREKELRNKNKTLSGKDWNLFARVLQEILVARNLGLGHLDDRAHIHPEKVRRLQRSLLVAKSFPMLNPDEMEEVFRVFKFTREEKVRLRAAVLATAIEATLMDRINQDAALRVAEQILPMIEQALQAHDDDSLGLGAVKGELFLMSHDTEIDRKLGDALASIETATIVLHLSRAADSHQEQVKCAKQALESFEMALTQLDKADSTLKETDEWQVWHNEAKNGYESARRRLRFLSA